MQRRTLDFIYFKIYWDAEAIKPCNNIQPLNETKQSTFNQISSHGNTSGFDDNFIWKHMNLSGRAFA